MLIAQLSDLHVGGARYREELLHTAIEEINGAQPDRVVVAGDITDEGYPANTRSPSANSTGSHVPTCSWCPETTTRATSATCALSRPSAREIRGFASRPQV
jgi:3',5'-cyclic AMP phosphodiesterase CpdA